MTTRKMKPNPLPPEPEKLNVLITGTAAGESLAGSRGDDTINGGAGNDILKGNSPLSLTDGHDVLNGGAGNDILYGAGGNDVYNGGDGIDTVVFEPNFQTTQAKYGAVVDLTVTGAQNTRYGMDSFVGVENLWGTEKNDRFTGNAEANEFRGFEGNDRLSGNGGKDVLDGGHGNDSLTGGAGDDFLYGSVGNDRLTGGQGADTFAFSLKQKSKMGNDRISDFKPGEDQILLAPAHTKSVSDGLWGGSNLDVGAFHIGREAETADHRVIYDKTSGIVWYDADGSGQQSALKVVQIAKNLSLSAADFLI
ncbi:MAG TPA: calcium-binding protein [Microvirga sp.]